MTVINFDKEPIIVHLEKRDSVSYAYLAFVIVGILIVIFSICNSNRKRMNRGQRPFISPYLAPPSYHQAQQQANSDQLPVYTPGATGQDAGYYDVNGNYVPYSTAPITDNLDQSTQQAYVLPEENNSTRYTRPEMPPPGKSPIVNQYEVSPMNNDTTNNNSQNESNVNYNEGFSSQQTTNYQRPPGPPPSRM